MSYTSDIVNYAVAVKYEDLPVEVVEQAKMLTMHTLGVAIAACKTEQGIKQIEIAKKMAGDKSEATILGDGSKVPCAIAGFANGTLSDILDWEDCSWTGHPSSGAIPAALAVSEMLRASGKDYLTAMVAAYEVYERIAMAVQPTEKWDFMDKGWGLTSWVIYSSAMAAGKLLKLNNEQMENLIGIAGVLTPVCNGRVHWSRTDFYHYQWGMNNLNGITGAFIARSGISPLPGFLDGERGHYWMALSDNCDWQWFNKDLGKRYLIMETYFKHWPTNMWINQPIDGLDAIIRKHKITADDIEEIIVTPEVQARMEFKPGGYNSITDAEFSIPYCLAMRLLEPEPGAHWYSARRMKDPRVLELASKVRAEGPVLKLNGLFFLFRAGTYPLMSVTVKTRDGRILKEDVPFPKGHPKNRITVDEFKDRFRTATSPVLPQGNIESAIDTIMNLEKVNDMNELTKLLHK